MKANVFSFYPNIQNYIELKFLENRDFHFKRASRLSKSHNVHTLVYLWLAIYPVYLKTQKYITT